MIRSSSLVNAQNFHSPTNLARTIFPFYHKQDIFEDDCEPEHHASADSGQSSSSPDLGESRSTSIPDSLEDNGKVEGCPDQTLNGAETNGFSEDMKDTDAQDTVKSLQESALNKIAQKSMAGVEPDVATPDQQKHEKQADGVEPTTDSHEDAISGSDQLTLAEAAKSDAEETLSAVTTEQESSKSAQSQVGNNMSVFEQPQAEQKSSQAAGNINNNYSGLNLNMTASEMRELLARRKKFDPKKAQMNIRQKYEIIQQM